MKTFFRIAVALTLVTTFTNTTFAAKKIPVLSGTVDNLTSFPTESLSVYTEGRSLTQSFGDGLKTCTSQKSELATISEEGNFTTPSFKIPNCNKSFPRYSTSISFMLDNASSPLNATRIAVISYDKALKKFPKNFVLTEIPNLSLPVKVSDGSDVLEWFKNKDGGIFMVEITIPTKTRGPFDTGFNNKLNRNKILFYSTNIGRTIDFDGSYFAFENVTRMTTANVTVAFGRFGVNEVHYKNTAQVKLEDLVQYLGTLKIVLPK